LNKFFEPRKKSFPEFFYFWYLNSHVYKNAGYDTKHFFSFVFTDFFSGYFIDRLNFSIRIFFYFFLS